MSEEPTFQLVVLVDDEEIDNLINQKMMAKTNFAKTVRAFSSATDALKYLEQFQGEGQHPNGDPIPDLIFLDINMPVMDGFQFLKLYKELSPKLREHAKVVMLSSSVNPEDKQRADQDEDVKTFITKPISVNVLQSMKG